MIIIIIIKIIIIRMIIIIRIKILTIIVVSAIRRGSKKGYPACLSIIRFCFSPHSRLSFFAKRNSFSHLKVIFVGSRTCGSTIAALMGQAVVDLKRGRPDIDIGEKLSNLVFVDQHFVPKGNAGPAAFNCFSCFNRIDMAM